MITLQEREQILAMRPGEELDILIAQKVMGWHRSPSESSCWLWPDRRSAAPLSYWNPSANIKHAMQVIEHLRGQGCRVLISTCQEITGWMVEFIRPANPDSFGPSAIAEELPLAICRAASLVALLYPKAASVE